MHYTLPSPPYATIYFSVDALNEMDRTLTTALHVCDMAVANNLIDNTLPLTTLKS
ncbi:hypothetical protein [Cysteiniphilum marinum]|uniref:hypothetical protein n=1 Tax=Cysteiniphilum marinum TaxID=2774191 RepID=UPI0019397227|nr:hypothetical protein [Cysteiniphilum marinum]